MSTIVTTSLPSSNTRSKTRERILKFVVSKSAIANSVSKRKGKKEKIATEGEQLDLGPGGARNKAKTISTSSQPETNRKQSRQTTAERSRKRKSRDEVPQSKKRSKSNTKRKNSYRELSPDRSNDPTKDVNKRKEKKRRRGAEAQNDDRSREQTPEANDSEADSEEAAEGNNSARDRHSSEPESSDQDFESPSSSSPSSSSSEESDSGESETSDSGSSNSNSTVESANNRPTNKRRNRTPKIKVRITSKDKRELKKIIGKTRRFDVTRFGKKPRPLTNKDYANIKDPIARITAKTQDIIRAHWDRGGSKEFEKTPGILPLSKPLWAAIAKNTAVNLGELVDDAVIEATRYIEPSVTIGASITFGSTPRKTKQITNKFAWLAAFNRYKQAVTTLYEHRRYELEEYQDRIFGLFADYPFAIVAAYDEEKRISLLLHRDRTLLTFDHHIETKYFNGTTPRLQNFTSQAYKRGPNTTRTCRDWNRTQGGCRFGIRCQYAHKCYRCESTEHPAYQCTGRLSETGGPAASAMGRIFGRSSSRSRSSAAQVDSGKK